MLKTPDLSKHFAPQPKPNAKLKSLPKPIPKIGKKGKLNQEANAKMYKMFSTLGITTCEAKLEKCWRDNALGYAHPDKRRFLSEEQLVDGILSCVVCHQVLEAWPREKMRKFVEDTIKKRKPTFREDKK